MATALAYCSNSAEPCLTSSLNLVMSTSRIPLPKSAIFAPVRVATSPRLATPSTDFLNRSSPLSLLKSSRDTPILLNWSWSSFDPSAALSMFSVNLIRALPALSLLPPDCSMASLIDSTLAMLISAASARSEILSDISKTLCAIAVKAAAPIVKPTLSFGIWS